MCEKFCNISAISWRPVLEVEEAGVSGIEENKNYIILHHTIYSGVLV
jgi:hypothetical protein